MKTANGYGFLCGVMKNILKLGSGDGYTILQIPKSTELDTIRG